MANQIIKIILTCLLTALAIAGLVYLIFLFGQIDYLPASIRWIAQILCGVMIGFSIYIAKRYLD